MWAKDRRRRASESASAESEELGPGNLFATGLVAGGAVAGVIVALIGAKDSWAAAVKHVSVEHVLTGALGQGGYEVLGLACFAVMAVTLLRVARRPS